MSPISASDQSIHAGFTGHLCVVTNGRRRADTYIAVQQ